MKAPVPILAAMLATSACDRAPPEPRVEVSDALITLPAIPGRPGAAYFTLNTNNDPTRLTGIRSPSIGRVELHETITRNGVARMVPLRETTFSPDAPLTFAAAGRHAMLFDIDPAVRVGSTVPVTFTFEPAPPVTIDVQVRAPGDTGHAGH